MGWLLAAAGWAQGGVFSSVVIDAGHGGKDPGATSEGVHEAMLNLRVAQRLLLLLEEEGVPVVMTRAGDEFLPLRERAAVANAEVNAALVSIHFNSSANRAAQGLETFYYRPASRGLADAIQCRMVLELKTVDRGVKKRSFTVLTATAGPAVLIEGGFLSNAIERARCASTLYQKAMARAIFDGLMEWGWIKPAGDTELAAEINSYLREQYPDVLPSNQK